MEKNALKLLYILFIMFFFLMKQEKKKQKINDKNYIYNVNYLANIKKVVYTALLGKYDNVHSIIKENGYDYFMFTDQNLENQSTLNWTILPISNEIKLLNMNIIKKQRFFKTHPHLFFKKYDLSIYIDSSFSIKGKLDEFLLRILTPKKSIYVLENPFRNNINNEFKAVINGHKDTKQTVISVKNKYNSLFSKML